VDKSLDKATVVYNIVLKLSETGYILMLTSTLFVICLPVSVYQLWNHDSLEPKFRTTFTKHISLSFNYHLFTIQLVG